MTNLTKFYHTAHISNLKRHLKKHGVKVPTEFLQLVGMARYFLNEAKNGNFDEYEELLEYLADMLDSYIFEGNDCFGYTIQVTYVVMELDALWEKPKHRIAKVEYNWGTRYYFFGEQFVTKVYDVDKFGVERNNHIAYVFDDMTREELEHKCEGKYPITWMDEYPFA